MCAGRVRHRRLARHARVRVPGRAGAARTAGAAAIGPASCQGGDRSHCQPVAGGPFCLGVFFVLGKIE